MANKNANPLSLWEFEANDIRIGQRLAFIGMSGSGKSVAMKTVIQTMKDKCFGAFAHSYTDGVQKFWKGFVPESFVYSGKKDLERLRAVYLAQQKLVAFLQKQIAKGLITEEQAKREAHLIIVLDDLMFLGNKVFKDELIREIWCNGRHAWMTVFISLQYAKGIDPTLRGQIDWSFIWKVSKPNERKKIMDEWVGYFKNYAEFDRAFNECTGDYQCMVVRSSPSGSNTISDNIFFWKPPMVANFSLGTPAYRQFHEELMKERKRQRKLPQVQQRKKLKTRSQGLKFFATEQDLYSPKGSLDNLPYHIRMHIYRIHIQSTQDTSVLAITQTCRGIYAEIYPEIKEKMVDKVFSPKTLVVVSGQLTFNKNMRVLKFDGSRYGLTLAYPGTTTLTTTATDNNTKADSDILGSVTSLEIQVRLPISLYSEPFRSSTTQMMKRLGSELVRLRELRVGSIWMMGYRRPFSNNDEDAAFQRQNLCTVLGTFLLIPTMQQLRLTGGLFYRRETIYIIYTLLDHLQIKYERVSESEIQREFIIKLCK